MIYGFHLSAQGARAQAAKLEVVANNLANAGTTAFKKSLAVFQDNLPYDRLYGGDSEPPGDLNQSTGGVTVAEIATDRSPGALQQTGGKLDVAITGHGGGYFQVADPNGRRFLTRNGSFTMDAGGGLRVQGSGFQVLNPDGEPIRLDPAGGEVRISSDGRITQGDAEAGRLALVTPASPDRLQPVGGNLYRAQGPVSPAPSTVQVRQGMLEASGTNSIQEILAMIQASRMFESNVNMIRYQDESMAQLLRSLPRR